MLWDPLSVTFQDPPPKAPSRLDSDHELRVKGQGEAETMIPEQSHYLSLLLCSDPLKDEKCLILGSSRANTVLAPRSVLLHL